MSEAGEEGGARKLTADQVEEIRQGRLLLHHLFSVLRTASYHQTNNTALSKPSEAFAEVLGYFMHKTPGPLRVEVGDGQMFAGVQRVRPSARQRPAIDGLEKFFKRRGIGGLIFKQEMDPGLVRDVMHVVVAFKKSAEIKNAVELINAEFEREGLADVLAGIEPVHVQIKDDLDRIVRDLGDAGQVATHLSKGVAMVKAVVSEDSEVARAGTRHVVRQVTDLNPSVRDAAVGLSMLGSSDDMAMRSLTVLMVAVAIAEELDAPRAVVADLGQACIELAKYDQEMIDGGRDKAAQGAKAIRWLLRQRDWNLSALRQGLALAGRYMPCREAMATTPANPMAEILRAACDFADMTTLSPMNNTEPLLRGAPLPPHEAFKRMQRQVGARYSSTVLRALLRGVGMLPVGTPVEMSDGHGAVVVARTEDPMTVMVQDTLSRRTREASFKPGPNQIVRVVTGGDLLKVRSHFLLGEDHEKLQTVSEEMLKMSDEPPASP